MRSKLCPRCKTGKESYELDKLSPTCPYISVHDGKKCAMFVELENEEGCSLFRRKKDFVPGDSRHT